MASQDRNDPLTTFCFSVSLDGIDGLFFQSVSGLKYEREVTDFQEGGWNLGARKLVGGAKWPNIVLKNGFTGNDAVVTWVQSYYDDSAVFKRKSGIIKQLKPDLSTVVCQWTFKNAVPASLDFKELDATKGDGLAIYELTLAHDGLTFKSF